MELMTRMKDRNTVSASDVTVVAAGASAITVNWWGLFFEWLPQMAQGLIVIATVIFVVVRAVNEVSRFIRENRRGDQE